jgi:UPF0755 protein
MRNVRILFAVTAALAAASCARQQQTYVIDPATGQPVPVVTQQASAQPQYAQQTYQQPAASGERGFFSSQSYAQQGYQQPAAGGERGFFSSQSYAQQGYQQPVAPSGRGLFNARSSAPGYMQAQPQPPTVLQYGGQQAPQYAQPQYAAPQPQYVQPQ